MGALVGIELKVFHVGGQTRSRASEAVGIWGYLPWSDFIKKKLPKKQ